MSSNEINRRYLNSFRFISKKGQREHPENTAITYLRIGMLPIVYTSMTCYSLLLIATLKTYSRMTARKPRYDYKKVQEYANEFVHQYPFLLYPLLTKALEVHILRNVCQVHLEPKVAEFAIGEGSLSQQVFKDSSSEVYGFDLIPYSLDKCDYPHVKQKIIADCLNPPMENNHDMTILSNNLMFHVTNKSKTIQNWAKKASRVIFTEANPFWARSTAKAYFYRMIGQSNQAEAYVKEFNLKNKMTLVPKNELDELIGQYFTDLKIHPFFNEFPYFLTRVYGLIFEIFVNPRINGAPVPKLFMKFNKGPLKYLSEFLTKQVANALIEFDAYCDDNHDVFMYYDGTNNLDKDYSDLTLKDPDTQVPIYNISGLNERIKNKLLFLLPKDMRFIFEDYDLEISSQISKKHL